MHSSSSTSKHLYGVQEKYGIRNINLVKIIQKYKKIDSRLNPNYINNDINEEILYGPNIVELEYEI
jgi:hypothetical protein